MNASNNDYWVAEAVIPPSAHNGVSVLNEWVQQHFGTPVAGQKLITWEFQQRKERSDPLPPDLSDEQAQAGKIGPCFMAILTVTQNDFKCEGDWQPSKRAAQRDTADKALKQLKAMHPEDASQEGQHGGDAGTAGDADALWRPSLQVHHRRDAGDRRGDGVATFQSSNTRARQQGDGGRPDRYTQGRMPQGRGGHASAHSGRGGQNTWGQTNYHGYGRAAAWGMFSGMPHQMSPYDPQPQYYDMQAPPVPPYMMQHENWYPEDHSFHPEPQGHQTGTGSYEHQPPTEATYEGGGPPVDVRTEEFEAQRTQYQGYEQGAWIGQ